MTHTFVVGQKIAWDIGNPRLEQDLVKKLETQFGSVVTVQHIMPVALSDQYLTGHSQYIILVEGVDRTFSGLWFRPVAADPFSLCEIDE